jgi:predicted metal-dependent HD superfamily phosphohydrolase
VDALVERWCAALTASGSTAGRGDQRAAGEALLARWSEPHRHYHTVEHLSTVLSTVDSWATASDDPDAVRLAAWYHDAVYEPRRGDNEEASAALAASDLANLAIPASSVTEITRLVLLTASHDPRPGDRNGALLCDADLSILAAPAPVYTRYAAAVRAEYGHVEDEAFRAGRVAVLQMFLRRSTLFHVPELQNEWEQKSRINLTNEVSALTADR